MTGKKQKALAALLSSNTQAEAAAKAGISTRALRYYLEDVEFCEEYDRLQKQAIADATRQLQKNLHAAIDALRAIIAGSGNDAAKIAASRTILEYGIRFTELHDMCNRLEAVERELDEL